ncbi:hypothetical protein B296_00019031 [Ensete ventricosum]|uniref:J domain-containing protein n=1 Tax=Ensete ventricosum TaxID=4639 RepID=A0A426YZ40_ENSVE|nr:hypothetical protein B296_00019031 [Ensete ventricosum]
MYSLSFSSHATTISWDSKPRRFSCRAIVGELKPKTNFYKVLSLESETVGVEEIKKAYRSMALRCHPDVCAPSRRTECTRMFIELQRAYETLSNPALRRKHDMELRYGGKEGQRRRPEFDREVWEAQLRGLRRRSDQREEATKVGVRMS